jgi:hypothetical protein
MINLLPCLVDLLHDLSPALPFLSICWPDACYISCPAFTVRLSACCLICLLLCHFYLSVGLMHATSAFPVHLPACCMINLLPCLYCPSVSLLHDLLPALPGIETNAQMFRYRSLGSKRNQNVLVCSKIFFFF